MISKRRLRLVDQPLAVQFLFAGGVVVLSAIASLFLLMSQAERELSTSQELARSHRTASHLNIFSRELFRHQAAVTAYLAKGQAQQWALVHERRGYCKNEVLQLVELAPGQGREIRDRYKLYVDETDRITARSSPLSKPETARLASLYRDLQRLLDRRASLLSESLLLRETNEKQNVQSTLMAIAIVNVLLMIVFSWVLMRLYFSIARPLSSFSEAIGRYRQGDLSARVPVLTRSELGFLAFSFNEMAGKIEAMVRDLKRMDELKTEFLSTVSHELRTPLTSIRGYVKLLLSGSAGELQPTQGEFLKTVETSAIRLGHLIDDLLDVEKLQSGAIELQKDELNLVEVLRECCATVRILAQSKNLELRAVLQAEPAWVKGDRARLIQLFTNLLSNAVKYTQKGYVALDLEEEGRFWVVRVRDTGMGIAPDEQVHLFEKFYRSPSAQKSGEGGTGLGLVIARTIAVAHGGEISMESQAGQGSTFSVRLPKEWVAP